MKLKTDLSDIRKTVLWLGFNDKDGSYGVKVAILFMLVTILSINGTIDYVANWNDIDVQVDVLKGMFVYVYFGLCLASIACDWKHTIFMIDAIENRFHKFPFRISNERLQLEAKVENEMQFVQSVWYIGRPSYIISEVLPPIMLLIFRLLTTNVHDLTENMLVTTHRYYWPKENKSLGAYFAALILQSSFYYFLVNAGYVMVLCAFVSMWLISGEMRLMALSIKEIDYIILDTKTYSGNNINKSTKNQDPRLMKMYINHIVNHHQHICRTAKRVNRGIQAGAFYLNFASSLLIVTDIYVMVKTDKLAGKLLQIVYCSFDLLTSYFYHIMGQEVLIQDENLRDALYQGQWTDKPQWFKKSLQIMMTRATKPIQMKPMGLFVLDMQNFQKILKAIYTFYNLLSNIEGAKD